jgi:hypothetical protein
MKNKLQVHCTEQWYKILYIKIRGLFNFAVGNRDSKTSEKRRLVNEENLEKSDRDPISEKPTISASTWNLGKPRKNTDQISSLLAEI